MNGEEVLGAVAQGLFADAKRNDPFVGVGDTELCSPEMFLTDVDLVSRTEGYLNTQDDSCRPCARQDVGK